MTIGQNIKRLRIQIDLTQAELGKLTKIPEFLIRYYELNLIKPRHRHLKAIARALHVDFRILLDANFDNVIAMHRFFQIFRKYEGYFDSCGNLKFKQLPLSDLKHQWEIYQKELMQAKKIKNKKERDYAIEDAEDKFNYWMDIYPKSNCYNINFDSAWNYYRETKKGKRDYKNIPPKNSDENISHNISEKLNRYLKCQRFITDTEVKLCNGNHTLSYILYYVDNSCLYIQDICLTIYGRECSSKYSTVHIGTDNFNILLLHLNKRGIGINKIRGSLSTVDASKKNWKKSIPFYADFNLHLHKDLPYQLEFHLFSDSYYKNQVELPADRTERRLFIEKFTEEHIKSNSWAAFQYDIIPH